jgi:hypothetical protein
VKLASSLSLTEPVQLASEILSGLRAMIKKKTVREMIARDLTQLKKGKRQG